MDLHHLDGRYPGEVIFQDVPCGIYTVEAEYLGKSKLVENAMKEVARTRWSHPSSTTSLDGKVSLSANTNKCSFFVYDMIQKTYGSSPTCSYWSKSNFPRNTVPALAKHWAEHKNSYFGDETEGWHNIVFKNESRPVKPGSILAISATYADATGHVGIVSYPKNGIAGAFVQRSGPVLPVPVLMQGQTISAAGDRVHHNNWGFRSSASPEKNSLNSPRSGIEVRE